MENLLPKINKMLSSLVDILFAPLAILASLTMWLIRRAGIERLPYTLKVFRKIGVFPLCDHYYEPLFNPKMSKQSLSEDRDLVGLDLNISEQLDLLTEFRFNN